MSLFFVEYLSTIERFKDRYQSDLNVIESTILPPLSESLWSFNIEQVLLLSEGILNFESVVAIEVQDSEEVVLFENSKSDKLEKTDMVLQSYELLVDWNGVDTNVGRLNVYQLEVRKDDELTHKFIYGFISSFLRLIIYLTILLLIITYRITGPLIEMTDEIKKLRSSAKLNKEPFLVPGKKKPLREIEEI